MVRYLGPGSLIWVIPVDIDAVGVAPLLGMDLMDSHSLYVEITDGGRVIIEPMG